MDSTTKAPDKSNGSLDPSPTVPQQTQKRHRCAQCPKTYTRRNDLRDHVRRVHDKKPLRECTECGKGFFTLRDFKRHSLLHKGVKEFVCDGCIALGDGGILEWGCRKAFAREDGLVAHLRSPGSECLQIVCSSFLERRFPTFAEDDDVEGSWTCRYRNPWRASGLEESPTGCGQQFYTRRSLGIHLWNQNNNVCLDEVRKQMKIDAAKAVTIVRQVQQRQDGPHDDGHAMLRTRQPHLQALTPIRGCVLPVRVDITEAGDIKKDKYQSSSIQFKMPIGGELCRSFDLQIGDRKIPSFRNFWDPPFFRVTWRWSLVAKPECLISFKIPDTSDIPDQAPIKLRANLIGDITGHSYRDMVLGFFNRINPPPSK